MNYAPADTLVAPARERGLKLSGVLLVRLRLCVAPARERGLKCPQAKSVSVERKSRSREGAWIEIPPALPMSLLKSVAPARERGLKSHATPPPCPPVAVAPARERGLKLPVILR